MFRAYSFSLPFVLAAAVAVFAFTVLKEYYFYNNKNAAGFDTESEQIRLAAIYSGKIHKNSTLYTELLRQEVPEVAVAKITNNFYELFDLVNSHPGDEFKLFLSPGDTVLAFEYTTNDLQKYSLELVDDRYVDRITSVELDKKIEYVGAMIETCLWDALVDIIPETELFTRITDIYAWEIDFLTESRVSDEFKMAYEALYDNGEYVKCGDIIAAEYKLSGIGHKAFLYTDPDGYTDYYDENGYSLQRALLKSPLNYRRVSSGYSYRRLHPIFKIYRPHLGVDYAAPIGTPVVAAGDGIIRIKRWVNGFGNYIEIDHDFGITTGYGHLNDYAGGIVEGRRVRQGQVIGYVGQTGIATGPHLDYRVKKNNRFVNPLRMTIPAAPPVKLEYLDDFKQHVAEMMIYLNQPVEPRLLVSNQKLAANN
jgi:murein DD-endopeptidase MepM/ murein hydrolase activator NlpD